MSEEKANDLTDLRNIFIENILSYRERGRNTAILREALKIINEDLDLAPDEEEYIEIFGNGSYIDALMYRATNGYDYYGDRCHQYRYSENGGHV